MDSRVKVTSLLLVTEVGAQAVVTSSLYQAVPGTGGWYWPHQAQSASLASLPRVTPVHHQGQIKGGAGVELIKCNMIT